MRGEVEKKETVFWGSIVGFFAVSLMGTACHDLYELWGSRLWVGMFAPVNESVWEHMKLIFYPYLVFMLSEYLLYGRKINGFLFNRTVGLLSGMLLIPSAFYVYTAVVGKPVFAVDLMIYYLSVGVSFYVSAVRLIRDRKDKANRNMAALVLLICFVALFSGLTFAGI